MSTEIAKTELDAQIMSKLVLTGDIGGLDDKQKVLYYNGLCQTLGINPLTQPFAIITFQGKKTLYATKGCAQQLCDTRRINTEVTKKETIDDIYIVTVRGTMADGRFTDEDGAIYIGGIKGQDKANAYMKAVTKAKRRAVLALCGLGIPDESEVVEDMPHAASETKSATGKSRVESMVEQQKDQVEEAVIVKKEPEPIKEKKTKKETVPDTQKTGSGFKSVMGLITEQPRTGVVDGKGTKYSFKIEDKFYGTFDTEMIKNIMVCVDKKIAVKFEYTERKNADGTKTFQDIVSFKQVSTDDVDINQDITI